MKFFTLASTVALCSIGVDASVWGDRTSLEARTDCPVAGATSIIKHDGMPVGKEQAYEGLNLYVSQPNGRKKTGQAVLYITDVFGIQLPQNKLLADSFARAGYVTVAPDLFDGKPAPEDLNSPGFNTTEFLNRYNANVTDPKLATSIKFIREVLGAKKVGAVGYCFGGRYSFRMAAEGKGLDATFAAHPSLLEDGEISAAVKPASLAVAETDSLLTPAQRTAIEAILQNTDIPYQVSLYSGTQHGFAVRGNVSNPEQKFGKEGAFLQAVRWFEAWM